MKDFAIAVWSWLVTPLGEPTGGHGRPKPLEGGRYRGKHRMRTAPKSTLDTTPEAGAWFTSRRSSTARAERDGSACWLAQHRRDFAQAYARAQGRAA